MVPECEPQDWQHGLTWKLLAMQILGSEPEIVGVEPIISHVPFLVNPHSHPALTGNCYSDFFHSKLVLPAFKFYSNKGLCGMYSLG